MEFTHPERSVGPDAGASPFDSFWGDCQKESAQQGGTWLSGSSENSGINVCLPAINQDIERHEAKGWAQIWMVPEAGQPQGVAPTVEIV